eukprot:TRINITY_DN14437_c0_g1_i1.p1 TRINITY_DN14437_c0_g1~~TRINITY_DN14437_c0_g1_i1.p1  ORF type:complete len:178 (-),score=46.45 TRINITY_DN14437_c0_g1_i1:36-527(-)
MNDKQMIEEIEQSMPDNNRMNKTGDIERDNELSNEMDREEHKMLNRKIALGIVGLFGMIITFVLEVFGAAGAIWGFSELITIRTGDNKDYWRVYASVVGVFALFRYVAVHMLNETVFERYEREIDEIRGYKKILKAIELPVAAVRCSFRSIYFKCKKSLYNKV